MKTRVAALLPDESGKGGVESHVRTLKKLLAPEVEVVTFSAWEGSDVTFDVRSKNPLTFLPRAAKLAKLLRDYDVVHSHSRVPNLLVHLARTVFGLRAPWVVTVHGFYRVNSYSSVLKWADAVVCITEKVKEHALKLGVEEGKISVIPNCAKPERRGEPSKERNILTVGRLVPSKNQLELLRAVAGADFSLFALAGSGKESYVRNLLREAERLGVQEKVRLLGPVENVWNLFPNFRVFLHSSSKPAPFSLAVLEAMAFGLPVIAWDCGDTAELVVNGVNGFRAQFPSEPFPIDSLQLLLDSHHRAVEMGAKGRELAERYSPEKVKGRLLELYEKLKRAKK